MTLRDELIEVVRTRGLTRLDEPVRLASGEMNHEYVDGKAAHARGRDPENACRLLLEVINGLEFDAVGGLTMGSDQFAHVVAVLAETEWFVVRKEPKRRGTNKLIEGANISPATRVLLVDDVVTTGGSIRKAYQAIRDHGATVVAAVTLVDRGDHAEQFFRELSVPYFALVTYHDLGIEPVGRRVVAT